MHLVEQILLVTRRVLDVGPDTVGVELSRVYVASERELWESVTDPSRLENWFEPVAGDLRPGGRLRFDSGVTAEIRDCVPEERLLLQWDDGTPATLGITLSDGDPGTRLTLTWTGPRDEQWDMFGPALVGIGWDSALVALALHLAMDTEAADGEEETFIRRLAGEWSGVDKHGVQQAQRTIDLYLGE